MSTTAPFPTPRDGLDTGSITELVADGREVQVAVLTARPWGGEHHDIDVPEGASSLVEGLDAYGS